MMTFTNSSITYDTLISGSVEPEWMKAERYEYCDNSILFPQTKTRFSAMVKKLFSIMF